MTCICKLSPQTPILKKDLGAWLKFSELFGGTRWDTFQTPAFQAFWQDPSEILPDGELVEGYQERDGVRTPYHFYVPEVGKTFFVEGQSVVAVSKEQWRNWNFTGCVWFDTDGTPHLRQEEANTHTFVYVQFER